MTWMGGAECFVWVNLDFVLCIRFLELKGQGIGGVGFGLGLG